MGRRMIPAWARDIEHQITVVEADSAMDAMQRVLDGLDTDPSMIEHLSVAPDYVDGDPREFDGDRYEVRIEYL